MQKEFTVYVERNGSVDDLLKEAENEVMKHISAKPSALAEGNNVINKITRHK